MEAGHLENMFRMTPVPPVVAVLDDFLVSTGTSILGKTWFHFFDGHNLKGLHPCHNDTFDLRSVSYYMVKNTAISGVCVVSKL